MESAFRNIRNTVEISMTVILCIFFFACQENNVTKLYILMLLYSCIISFHYAIIILNSENKIRMALLVCLFVSYAAFCHVSAYWPALLLLPCLLCYHGIAFVKHWKGKVLTVILSIVSMLIILLPDLLEDTIEHKSIKFLSYSAVLIVNAAICFALFIWVEEYIKNLENIRTAMSSTAVNELTEKIYSLSIAQQKDIAVQNARLEERETISRNMHNAVGHTITSSIMTLEAAHVLYDVSPDESKKKVLEARDKISHGLESIRQIVRMLDPENETTSLSDLVFSMRV